jgi:ADP-heptose:LPS heptosyltransferase
VPNDYTVLELPKIEKYKNALFINRRDGSHDRSQFTTQVYKDIISQFDEKYFLCFNQKQYDDFFLKKLVEPLLIPELHEYMVAINSCKLFLGNQSGPFSMASVLNVSRIGELFHKTLFRDDLHYLNDGKLHNNVELFNMENILTDKNIYLRHKEYYSQINV